MKKGKYLSVIFYIVVSVMAVFSYSATAEAAVNTAVVTLEGYFDYSKIHTVLTETNKLRQAEGLQPLSLDKELTEAAMQRAAEIQLVYADHHARPNGKSWYTVSDKADVENIAIGQTSAKEAVAEWKDSESHYRHIMDADYKSIGIGCFYQGKTLCWVQLFGLDDADEGVALKSKLVKTVDIEVREDWLEKYTYISGAKDSLSIVKGATAGLQLQFFMDENSAGGMETFVVPGGDAPVLSWNYFTAESSKPSVISINTQYSMPIMTAKKTGSSTLSVKNDYLPGKNICSYKFKVIADPSRTIVLDANKGFTKIGSLSSKQSGTVINGSKYGTLPSPVRPGYTFSGWYTKKTGGSKITANSKVNISGKSKTLYAHWKKVSVKKVTISKPKSSSKGQLTAKWKKLSGAKGYEVQVSTSKKFTKKTTKSVQIVGASKTSYTFKGLKKGKRYYVRVRAYNLDSYHINVYGKYSSVKYLTVKKK